MTKTVSDLQARISQLPRRAQRDIERAVAILREEFAAAVVGSKAPRSRSLIKRLMGCVGVAQ